MAYQSQTITMNFLIRIFNSAILFGYSIKLKMSIIDLLSCGFANVCLQIEK